MCNRTVKSIGRTNFCYNGRDFVVVHDIVPRLEKVFLIFPMILSHFPQSGTTLILFCLQVIESNLRELESCPQILR